ESTYRQAVDVLINTDLLNQFLARQNVPVTPAKVDAELERMKQQFQKDGQDFNTTLLQSGSSLDELRKNLESRIRWSEWVNSKATDAMLRRFLGDNRDLFSGTQVRASHILLRVEPSASEADKEKVKQKLLNIKNEILQNKVTFAEA